MPPLLPRTANEPGEQEQKRIQCRINAKIPSREKLGMVAVEQKNLKDGMHQSPMQNSSNDATRHTQTSMESFPRK
jgi:hypothetical protein